MSESRHTHGSWTAHCGVVTGNWYVDAGNDPLADLRPPSNTEANARLIAAAPDLLEVARRVLEWWHNLPPQLRQDIEGSAAVPGCIAAARTAIAKATGDL